MAGTTTPDRVIQIARSQLGTTEKPANSNHTAYGVWYGLDKQPWCAMFVSWVMHRAGYPLDIETPKGFAWTPAGVNYAKRIKRWIEPNALRPGDIVFFNFDNDAGPEHTGLVEKRLGIGHYLTIEGNTGLDSDANGGEVMERDRKGSIILGALRPSYAAAAPPTPRPGPQPAPAPQPADTFKHPTLEYLDVRHGEVKHMQALLHRCGAIIVMDGVFGQDTLQKLKAFQKANRLTVDGVCGPRTWSKLHELAR